MPLNLKHLRPCDQSWEDMTPTERGRLCAACKKEIFDFRGSTDLEIARVHAESGSGVCGLYSSEQLAGSRAAELVTAATLALGAALAPASAVAAALPPADPHEIQSPVDDGVSVDTLRLQGVLLDGATRAPLSGAIVMIRGTKLGTITDSRGRFSLRVPVDTVTSVRLTAMLIGYAAKDVDVASTGASR